MKANLFIVEDEMPIVTLLKYNLEKEGHKVNYALNGEDAIRSIKDQNPDLILLDWMLPDLSGIDICKQIKKDINIAKEKLENELRVTEIKQDIHNEEILKNIEDDGKQQ